MGIFDIFNKENKKKLEDTVKNAFKELEHGAEGIYSKSKDYVDNLKDNIYTDGHFDKAKAQKILENTEDAIKVYGEKAVKRLKEAIAAGAEKMQDYIILTDEQVKKDYAGIGSRYKEAFPEKELFKKDYDNCLKFLEKAPGYLPQDTMYKTQIIQDIKDSVSENASELINFYDTIGKTHTSTDRTLKERRREVERYFLNK